MQDKKKGKLDWPQKNLNPDYPLPECTRSVQNKTDIFAFWCEINTLPNNFGTTKSQKISKNLKQIKIKF